MCIVHNCKHERLERCPYASVASITALYCSGEEVIFLRLCVSYSAKVRQTTPPAVSRMHDSNQYEIGGGQGGEGGDCNALLVRTA